MGYDRHHAILVTAWSRSYIDTAHAYAENLGLNVTDVVRGKVNSWRTFAVVPDGSKEGWRESDEGDQQRAEFVAWLRQQEHGFLDFVEVQYAASPPGSCTARRDDNRETLVLAHSDDGIRA